ncbi:hypothetical protein JW948_01105 [bacterium]|nr:hypothetical protein [bacterium]
MKRLIMVLILIPFVIRAQGLFDSAVDAVTQKASASPKYELNGFVRGTVFGGLQSDQDTYETKAGYGELGLKFRARKGEKGSAFAEIRLRRGHEFGQSVQDVDVREAYVNLYLGNWDIRLGEQIVVWGRADGYNPTNNLTPQNMLIRSGDDDDRRLANFLVRGFYTLNPIRFEWIWVPRYASSVLPVGLFQLPAYVQLAEIAPVEATLNNSTLAMKLHGEFSRLDGSVSFVRGFMPLPGIDASATVHGDGSLSVSVTPKPYQMRVFGADFSTTLGSFGIRGEIAYRDPAGESPALHVPNPDIQWIFGGDRTWGDFNLILQYIGKKVQDFEEFHPSGSPTDDIWLKNRMIAMQQHEMSHGLTCRPALGLMHETLTLETLIFATFTTEEIYIRPKMTYQIADELTGILGADIYTGPDDTLFGSIDRALNSIFVELRASF